MTLTEEQLQMFEENGFLLLPEFAEHELCNTIKDIANAHLKHKVPPVETETEYVGKSKEERKYITDGKAHLAEGRITVRRLRQVYHRDIVFRHWMENKKIRPVLRQVLGEAPVITIAHHNSIMTKMPHTSTETRWHQDFRYWSFENDNLVSVWLALDEENSDNGVLEFIPGSHKMSFDLSQFDEKEYFSDTLPQNREIVAKRVSHPLRKGDVVLFHCKLLHRANRNMTDAPKISFVYTVKGCSNKAIEGTRSTAYEEVPLD
ncbi:phytanoyl-CoA dioxygenase family protein [Sulfurovum sp.]|uniref:phytanoyl-CoA dioxygenase family protein n=1 Tax=Sulfurovum sp. TaxID=1969726 RepID=UPI0025D8A3B0|nr:phytanoyl-CoA dioxygenase family protein [Sulfurovum sp.]